MTDLVALQGMEAERALLGCVIEFGKRAWLQVAEFTDPDDFSTQNRAIYTAIAALDVEGLDLTYLTISQQIERDGTTAATGGRMYLSELQTSHLCLPCDIASQLHPLREAAIKRRVGDVSLSLAADLESGTSTPAETIERHTDAVLRLTDAIHRGQRIAFPIAEVIPEVLDGYGEMMKLHEQGRSYAGIDSGFPELNTTLNGFLPEEMTVLAARPSIGKTTLALQIVGHVAANSGKHVGIWSCEMSRGQLAGRLVQMTSGIDAEAFRKGRLGHVERGLMVSAAGALSELPLTIYETPGLTVPKFVAMAEQLRARHDVGLLVIDHLHRMDGPGSSSYERQSAISQGLRNYSLPTGSPHMLVIAQLSRKPEERPDKRPQLADLRDAGGIEQDAVNTLLLHRPGFYAEIRAAWKRKGDPVEQLISHAELIAGKTRFGPTGEMRLHWDSRRACFASAAPSYLTGEVEL